MRFSTPKKTSAAPTRPAIRPWRDGLLAGLGVAAAISFGAWVVYARACDEKVRDVRQQLRTIAAHLLRIDPQAHRSIAEMPDDQAAKSIARVAREVIDLRDSADEVARIYSFNLSPAEEKTVLDTGRPGEKPGSAALPKIAHKIRSLLPSTNTLPLLVGEGLAVTAFGAIRDADGRIIGGFGIEADGDKIGIQLATIRRSLIQTCGLGILAGLIAGGGVARLRSRAARMQAEIAASRRVEDAIIASLGEIVYTLDLDSRQLRWRGDSTSFLPTASRDAHFPVDHWVARIHPDDTGRYLEALRGATTRRESMEIEYRVKKPAGGFAWILDRAQPVAGEEGESPQLAGSLMDISARRAIEESLRLFFEETATAHLALDGDTIVEANPAAVTLFGAPDAAALSESPIWTLWPKLQPTQALSASIWADNVMLALEKRASHFEWRFRRLDGRPVDCHVFLRHATFRDRDVLMLGCIDISAAKEAQAQLIASEQRFRDVSEAIGEFIWEVDETGRFTYASPRVRDVLGCPAAEVLGRHPLDFVPPEDVEKVRADSAAIEAAGEAFRDYEHRIRRPDGRTRWITVSGVPRLDGDGRVVGFRGASLDVTSRHDFEDQLLRQKEAAEAGARAKGNFLAMMSHEIRTPLNSVLGFADLLLNSPLDAGQREHLQTIRGSGGALLLLLNDILDFSKIESGHLEVEPRVTDLPRSLRETVDLHRAAARAKKLPLRLEIDPDVPEYILTDSDRLRQILLNLVGNAVKFTAQGSVLVHVSRHEAGGDRLQIRVRDTGIGITPEQRTRIFLPFTQADSSTTRQYGGTGLGLAISRRLAELLGGDLGLEDTPAPGATFVLTLPAVIPSPAEIARAIEPPALELLPLGPAGSPRSLPRALVVDDNTLNRRLTAQMLRQLGVENETAASAEECFARLAVERFDVILMDVQMPGMDGLEATRHIRAREAQHATPRIRIVALTADAMVGDRERCLQAGMDDYLTKPIRREALARAVLAPPAI